MTHLSCNVAFNAVTLWGTSVPARRQRTTMSTSSTQQQPATELLDTLHRDGIIACKGAFSTEWADRMREDIEVAFEEARSRPDGAVGRGPNRYYVEIHPEQLRGFVDLVDHPWVREVCTAVLGPDYEIVELGFDIPFAGSVEPAVAPGLPRTGRDDPRPRRLDVAGVQPHGRRHGRGHGPVRDRARHPVRRRRRIRPRDVPARRRGTAVTRSGRCASTPGAGTSRRARP